MISLPLLLLIGLAIVSIAFCFLPFYVISINKKMDRMLKLMEEQSGYLEQIEWEARGRQ